jgi:hypothetical protein
MTKTKNTEVTKMEDKKINWQNFTLAEYSDSANKMAPWEYCDDPDRYVKCMREFRQTESISQAFFWPDNTRGESEQDDDWSGFGPPSANEIDWSDFPPDQE